MWITSCSEAKVLRIWRFWTRVSWELTLGLVDRQLGCLPLRQPVEVGARTWRWEVAVRPWCWEVRTRPWCWEVRPGSWDFEVGQWKKIVEFLPLGHRVGFRPLKNVVSIVWYEKLLRIVSVLMSKNRSQKLINGLYLNNGVASIFVSAYCVLYFPVFVLYLYQYCCYWYHQIIQQVWG